MLLERARESPDTPAIVEQRHGNTVTMSFGELELRSCQAARSLHAAGVTKGSPVLLFHPATADLYIALVALLRIGAVAVVIDPSGGRALLRDACALLPPAALFASPKAHLLRLVTPALRRIPARFTSARALWSPLVPARLLTASERDRIDEMHDGSCVDCANDDLALVTFTSGSTGRPKGARRTHGILRAQHLALCDVAAQRGETDLVTLPIVVLSNLASGAVTVLPGTSTARPRDVNASAVARQIDMTKVTRITTSPAIVEMIADHAMRRSANFNGLRAIVTGGGPVFPDIIARARRAAPNARVISVYGSTEAEPIAHIGDGDISPADMVTMESGAGLLVGHPVGTVQLRIVREHGARAMADTDEAGLAALVLPPDDVGEIVVAGNHVVQDYVNGIGDIETKFRVDGTVWHRTGDAGRIDDQGRLWLLGRCSAAVRDARGTVHPFAVECAVRSRLGLREVALVQWKGERVLVVCTPVNNTPTVDQVQTALPWAGINRVTRLARIPMDARHNSKVNYPALLRALARSSWHGLRTHPLSGTNQHDTGPR